MITSYLDDVENDFGNHLEDRQKTRLHKAAALKYFFTPCFPKLCSCAAKEACLPRTGAKKIKLKTKLDTTHTNSARQLPDFAPD